MFDVISTMIWVYFICALLLLNSLKDFRAVWSFLRRYGIKVDLWVINDRGIDVVRNKIKMFAQKKVTLPPGRHKIVLLDEADRWSSGGHKDALYCVLDLTSSRIMFQLISTESLLWLWPWWLESYIDILILEQ